MVTIWQIYGVYTGGFHSMVPPALRHHTLKFELQFIDVSGVFLAWPLRDGRWLPSGQLT